MEWQLTLSTYRPTGASVVMWATQPVPVTPHRVGARARLQQSSKAPDASRPEDRSAQSLLLLVPSTQEQGIRKKLLCTMVNC